MDFNHLLEKLAIDTVDVSLWQFLPELALCATIVIMLLARMIPPCNRFPGYGIAATGALLSFAAAWLQFLYLRLDDPSAVPSGVSAVFNLIHLTPDGAGVPGEMFTGLLVFDHFTVFFRLLLALFVLFVIALTVLTGIPDDEDAPDFYTLLLGATIGMMLMASANHLLILFLGVEMASVPSYAMVGFLKGRRLSSEAALKFVVYGAGAAGVMLYGTSLLAGLTGTANLGEIAARLEGVLAGAEPTGAYSVTILLAVTMILVGLAFKLSLVPFHFWCPDAFEGASAEVAGFLSVASKAAAFALLVRVCLIFVGDPSGATGNLYLFLGIGLGVIAAVTMTYGNLTAYEQTNVKRLLAYSTIAHAGFMLMAVSAMMVILNGPEVEGLDRQFEATRCLEGLLYYLAVYLFMNLGAFAIVALIRNHLFSEEIDDYNGLLNQCPILCVCMLVCLVSLVGIPPTGGFFGKLLIFMALFKATDVHWFMWALIVIGGLNTVFSLYYYVNVLKAMFIAERPEGARRAEVPLASLPGAYVVLISAPVLVLGCTPLMDGLTQTAHRVASVLIPSF